MNVNIKKDVRIYITNFKDLFLIIDHTESSKHEYVPYGLIIKIRNDWSE